MPAYVRLRSAEQFRSRIVGLKLTQTQVARQVGLSNQRISQLVTGYGQVIRASHAVQLEDLLGVKRAELFTAEEPELIRLYLDGRP
jgi:transcriptional regulator with XRE-family HTH domain